MKSIVLAEKPSVGRDLARVLGCGSKQKSFIEGKNYIVTWAMGHLVELADPETYNEKWKTWALEALPMLPEKMRHKVIRKTSHQFNTVKRLFQRNDVDSLIIATDAGREGELVARWIMRLCGWKGKTKRLWISSQTDAAIKEGFRNLRDGGEYINLFRAAESRAEADWIIGLNCTRALSCKYDVRLSAGRVQTPTLALVIQREKEIESFTPKAYWNVTADFGPYTGKWAGKNGSSRIQEQSIANSIAEKIEGKTGKIEEVSVKKKSIDPPLAYDLTALQVDANRILGFSPKKTLQTLQILYERHKIVTYPRTDSRYITEDIVPTLPRRLESLFGTPLKSFAQKIQSGEMHTGKRFVNSAKVKDHHALIPTEERVRFEKLSSDERAVWELVVRRFLEVLSPVYRYKQILLVTNVEGEIFQTRGVSVLDKGWKALSRGPEPGDEKLGHHEKGEFHKIKSVKTEQLWTKPPARYTEGTLISAMENAGKFIDDKDLKKSIEQGGLGTPATRADILEKLLSNYYLEPRGKELWSTPRGRELLNLVPEQLSSPELTAEWEIRLSNIADGKEKHFYFLKDIRQEAKNLVSSIKNSTKTYSPEKSGYIKNEMKSCPMCGKPLYPVRGRKGRKMLVCQGLSCGYEEIEGQDQSGKPSEKEKRMAKRLIRQYSGGGKETSTFGDLLKASLERQKERESHEK